MIFYLIKFEFHPINQTLSQQEFPRSKVFRSFDQLEEDGSSEATVSRIFAAFLSAVTRATDPPVTPDLSPLLKCVGEAMKIDRIARPLPAYLREVKLDVVGEDGLRHPSFRAKVERLTGQAVVEDVGDIDDEELEDWMMDDQYDDDSFRAKVERLIGQAVVEDVGDIDDEELEDWMMDDQYDDDYEMIAEEEEEEEENGEDDGESAIDLEGWLKGVRVGIEVDCCGVCLDEMAAGSEAEAMGCGHIYHGGCIRKWLRHAAACPLCRFPAAGQ